MATKRKIFTYDTIEDKDIDDFFESLPQRQASKYIRIGLRMVINEMNQQKQITSTRSLNQTTQKEETKPEGTSTVKEKETGKETNEINKDDDEYMDSDDILNLGK